MERGHGMGELRSMISKETGKNGNLFPICAAGIKMQSHRRLTFLRSNPQQRRRCGSGGGCPFFPPFPVFQGLWSCRSLIPPSLSLCFSTSIVAAILFGGLLVLGISCQSVALNRKRERKILPRFSFADARTREIDPAIGIEGC